MNQIDEIEKESEAHLFEQIRGLVFRVHAQSGVVDLLNELLHELSEDQRLPRAFEEGLESLTSTQREQLEEAGRWAPERTIRVLAPIIRTLAAEALRYREQAHRHLHDIRVLQRRNRNLRQTIAKSESRGGPV